MKEFEKKNGVRWSVNISAEVNDKFEDYVLSYNGKINKSKLINYLLDVFIENNKISEIDVEKENNS